MAAARRRGLVFLYAISVFVVIAAVGMTILESGENFVDVAGTDIFAVAAQQAALSGMAYGEAMIYRMLHLRDPNLGRPDGSGGTGPFFPTANTPVPMPFWAGAKPNPSNGYIALQGWGWDQLSPNNLSARYTFAHEMVAGTTTPRLLGQFRIELRECSLESPTAAQSAACQLDLFDLNMRRNGIFWPNLSSDNMPKQTVLEPHPDFPALEATVVSNTALLYTMRVEGLAIRRNPDNTDSIMAHTVLKQSFSLTEGSRPEFEIQPHAFWYQSLQRGY